METKDLLPIIVSAIVALITLFTIIVTQNFNKKQLRIQAISMQRVDWLASVRDLLSAFGIAYRKNSREELEDLRFKLLLYLRIDKPHYELLTEILNICCNNEYNDETYSALILISQRELARVWERLNAEATISLFKRLGDSEIINTVDNNTSGFLKLLEDSLPHNDPRFENLTTIIEKRTENSYNK